MTTIETISTFLNRIGIKTGAGPVPRDAFLPGIRVDAGRLVYDAAALAWPGELLHEAGHVAVMPAVLRPLMHDGLQLEVAVDDASEAEATAWAYAAVRNPGLDPALLFHGGGYGGASPGLRATFALGVYPGAAGLARAGMTYVGQAAREQGLPVYPAMLRWLRA